MKRLIPDTIASRTLLVLIIGLTVSHALSIALYVTDRGGPLMFIGGAHVGERIVTIDRLVINTPQAGRQRIVELADGPRLHVALSRDPISDDGQGGGWRAGVLRGAMMARMNDGGMPAMAHMNGGGMPVFRFSRVDADAPGVWREHFRNVHRGDVTGEIQTVSLQLPDGTWLNFAVPAESPEPFWSLRFALSIVVMLLAVGILSALVVRHLTRPLATFALAAQRLGVDVKAPPIPESGPAEVRQAAHAFNEMQDRIRRVVEDRTQMVAAISHDLGTPITRLRLRAELIDDEEQREKVLADLADMEKMVFSVLSFARDEAAGEPRAMVDLKTLLQRVCDDATDAGYEVSLDVGDAALPLGCRPAALRRALSNLIENAAKYGHRARVSLDSGDDEFTIRIDDDGPGIPEELHEEVFKPFRRLETSRSRETGGTGLGLAVARGTIRAHGGDVRLVNRSGGGLRVEIYLPR